MSEKEIKNNVEIYANEFVNNLVKEYQTNCKGIASWKDLLNMGFMAICVSVVKTTKNLMKIGYIKKFEIEKWIKEG